MQAEQINIEYFFRLLYELFFSGNGTFDLSGLKAFLAQLWFWVVVVGYAVSVLGFFVIIYATMKLFDLRKREKEHFETLIVPKEAAGERNMRWQHIQELLDEKSPSAWREAISEADIMLDSLLKKRGYVGDTVADKLRDVKAADLTSLNDAWEAHKVRNRIAHDGSAFPLSEELAQRTMARYENVFREWGEV